MVIPEDMSMKKEYKFLIAAALMTIILVAAYFFIPQFFEGTFDKSITAIELVEEPDIYFNVTEQHMDQFPHLKEAINSTEEHIKVTIKEWEELIQLFDNYNTKYIKYQDKYYEILFTTM
jgi:uncharacterized protein (UPF0333 family)